MLLIQAADFAFDFALANAGKSILANIAMMAITTNNSIKVKARLLCMSLYWLDCGFIDYAMVISKGGLIRSGGRIKCR
jgi:hypothetical protein